MCGIAGSITLEKAHELYLQNLDRGGFGSGFLAVSQSQYTLLKSESPFELDFLKEQTKGHKNIWYYLFHSRAPTNEDSTWDYNTTHPFVYRDWVVAHNGIISNAESFKRDFDFQVDTQLIPYHLFHNFGKIKDAFEPYEGLLTSWLYDSHGDFLYLVKGGSTLYIDNNSKSFSSKPFNDALVVEDGTIWCYLDNKWIQSSTFNYNNPYFL